MVAVLRVSSNRFEMAREDTGSPVSMYVRTISAKILRFRRSWRAAFLISSTLLLVLDSATSIVGMVSSVVNGVRSDFSNTARLGRDFGLGIEDKTGPVGDTTCRDLAQRNTTFSCENRIQTGHVANERIRRLEN